MNHTINYFQFDNFLDNPDEIRKSSLELNYTPKNIGDGWDGYRCLYNTPLSDNLLNQIKSSLIEKSLTFINASFKGYFHYTLEETNNSLNKIHKDSKSDYAGVLYLYPTPSLYSGTAFYNENGNEIYYIDNIYNRLVIYPSNMFHSLKTSFGDNINNGRLTFTFFCNLESKSKKTII